MGVIGRQLARLGHGLFTITDSSKRVLAVSRHGSAEQDSQNETARLPESRGKRLEGGNKSSGDQFRRYLTRGSYQEPSRSRNAGRFAKKGESEPSFGCKRPSGGSGSLEESSASSAADVCSSPPAGLTGAAD